MATYKSSFVSFIGNYVICGLIILFLVLLFSEFNLVFTFQPQTEFQFTSSLTILIAVLLIVILADEPFFERMMRTYIVTDEEVVKEEGIIRKKRIAIPLKNVADVTMDKGVIGRIFNFGNVVVKGMKTKLKMKGLKNPENVYELIKSKAGKALKEKE